MKKWAACSGEDMHPISSQWVSKPMKASVIIKAVILVGTLSTEYSSEAASFIKNGLSLRRKACKKAKEPLHFSKGSKNPFDSIK